MFQVRTSAFLQLISKKMFYFFNSSLNAQDVLLKLRSGSAPSATREVVQPLAVAKDIEVFDNEQYMRIWKAVSVRMT